MNKSSITIFLTLLVLLHLSPARADSNHLELLSKILGPAKVQLFRNLHGQKMKPTYEFDVGRTPEKALEEGVGGACNTQARVAALELMKNGAPAEDLRIVSAVNDSSLDQLCLGKKNAMSSETDDGLAGHVFLLLKSNSNWYLVNTTTVPNAPPDKRFGKLGLEYIQFLSPGALDDKMKAGPVSIPNEVIGTLPSDIFGPMTIFSSVRPDQYPLHDFSGRRRLVASGTLSSAVCRYNGAGH